MLTDTGRAYTGGDPTSFKLGRGLQGDKDMGLALVPGDHFFTSMHVLADYTLFGTRAGTVLICGYFARKEYATLTEMMSFSCPVRHVTGDSSTTLVAVSELGEISEIVFNSREQYKNRVEFSSQRYNVCTAVRYRHSMFICLMDKQVNISFQLSKLMKAQENNLLTDITIIL